MFNPLFIKYELVECYYEGGNYPYENYKKNTLSLTARSLEPDDILVLRQ